MSKVIWESAGDRRCPGCGGQLDDWGLCPEALSRIGLDLASAWRLVSQRKKRPDRAVIRTRVTEIVAGQINGENAGSICLICGCQFYHGVCPGCGLRSCENSSFEIYLLFLSGRWP